jgi:glycosyltransferase involved in cell wall biosynthesis
MNVVVTAKLADSKLKTKLIGLQDNQAIQKIYLVRQTPLKGVNVINVTPSPYIAQSRFLYEIWRLFQLLYLMSKKENQVAIGIQFFLHGFTAILAAKIFRKKSIVWLIGSDVMLHGQKKGLRWFFIHSLRSCDAILIMGNKMRSYLGGITPSKIFEMQSYIDPDIYRPIEPVVKDWDIGFIGNLVEVKRVDIILQAISINKNKGKSYRTVIVGDGPLRTKLEAIVSKLGISDLVKFIGVKSDISALINYTRLVVLSSKSEGLPAILLESAFCGTPSISSDVGEISEVFNHHKCCEVVTHSTADVFAKTIDRILSDPESISIMEKQSLLFRGDYLHKWGKEGQVDRWQFVINKALTKS